MLDTTEAAMMEANDFQDSSGVLLSSEKCDIPLTITHSMFISWAAANSPVSGKKNRPIKYVSLPWLLLKALFNPL